MAPTTAGPTTARTRQPRHLRADAIVAEALRLFSERGFRGTTIAAVADGVGLTDAGVLHHFPTKRALLTAVLERSTEDQTSVFRDLLGDGGIAALRRFGEWGRVMTTAPQFMRLEVALSADAIDPSSELHAFFATRYEVLHRWLTRVLAQGIERGEIRDDVDVEYEVAGLVAFLDGMRLQWFFREGTPLAVHVRTYVDQLCARIEEAS